MFERVRHKQTFFGKLWYIYGQRLHRLMIAKNANVFMKPTDIISHRPTLFGMHEPHIEKLIAEAALTNGDFLIDLGANIGMTSALAGHHFTRVDCVEPNELVVNILKTNLAMNLPTTDHEVHAIGLGKEDGVLKLRVPADNFGGAYVETGNPQFEGETRRNIPITLATGPGILPLMSQSRTQGAGSKPGSRRSAQQACGKG